MADLTCHMTSSRFQWFEFLRHLRSECALKKQNIQILPEPNAGHVTHFFVYKIMTLILIFGLILPLHLKQNFLPRIWIFTGGEGDKIESRLPFKIFSTLICSILVRWSVKDALVPLCYLATIKLPGGLHVKPVLGLDGLRHLLQANAKPRLLLWSLEVQSGGLKTWNLLGLASICDWIW